MKVLITGATGYIGGAVVRRFAATEHRLVCLVRREQARAPLEALGAHVAIGDINRTDQVLDAMYGCDAVLHLAAAYDFWRPHPEEYEHTNVEGTLTVLSCALECDVRKVIYVSTAAVWGDAEGVITEDTPFGAHCASEYARSKREAEALAWRLHESRGLPLVVIHPAAVVGPHDPKPSGRYIERVAKGALPAQILTGHAFSFVHVRDVAEAILRALEKPDNIGARYLVSAATMTWGELNRAIADAAGAKLPRMHLPDWVAVAGASALTVGAELTKHPPAMDLALDQVLLMKQGMRLDGSRAERELGFRYTPLAQALAEELAEPVHA